MTDPSEFYCKIFFQSDASEWEMATRLAEAFAGTVSGPAFAPAVRTTLGEIEVRKNRDGDEVRARDFPDGFLFFRYALELEPFAATPPPEWIDLVGNMLRLPWSQGWSAVAACGFENHLPLHGGYDTRSIPWPIREVQPK